MKAVFFHRFGVSNLEIGEFPTPSYYDKNEFFLIKVMKATLNPIDFFTVEGRRKVSPLPHIPGVEIYGEIAEGSEKGKKVIVYPRIFCGNCYLCVSGKEMICTGELFGVSSNGGFAEYTLAPKKNTFFVDDIDEDLASSLTVGALTAYHSLSYTQPGEKVAVLGATGNTGIFSIQLAKLKGCEVYAITRKKSKWLKDFGADEILTPENSLEKFKGYFDTVIDPLGSQTFNISFQLVSKGGKIITFGVLTGQSVELNILELYSKHISFIGITGGTRKELFELIEIAKRKQIKVKLWKEYPLEKIKEAFSELFSREREGKISIKIQ
jgi:NADPH:quinone reductase-like Zn-dependent oxidoreductase